MVYNTKGTRAHTRRTDLGGGGSRASQEALWPPVLKARRKHGDMQLNIYIYAYMYHQHDVE